MTTSTQAHGSPPVFVTYPELHGLGVTYSRKHLLDLMRRGLFPACRQISANRIAWVRAEILNYLETRPVARAALFKQEKAPAKPKHEGGDASA
jgi:predicted DNA-binding transcriptional regulator AlpA